MSILPGPLPETMIAIAITAPGGAEVLRAENRLVPVPGPGDILIETAFAGVNRPDVLQRAGAYPPPKGASDLPGLEVSGHVVAVGDGTERYTIGDPVCALCPGGGYAQYVTVPEAHALPVPRGLSLMEAAALPETFFTVWANVFQRGRLSHGDVFLVHGGSSGIGTTAIQLARGFGATVIATAGTAEKCAACLELGAHHAINYRQEDFVVAVKALTDNHGADVILDMVGGSYIARNHAAAAMDGRIVQIAFLGGSVAEVDFTRLMIKRLTHTGSTLRPQSDTAKAKIAQELASEVWPLLEAGTIKPRIDSVFPLTEAARAHAYMESGQHIGKIMLRVQDM